MASDEETIANLHQTLSDTTESAYDVVFATLEYSDHAGHTLGYGNHIDGYVEASMNADKEAYALIQTIQNRETYREEDWLIILTTDHGGIDFGHGGQSLEEVNTWFAINKKI